MTRGRIIALTSLAAAAALTLTACGSSGSAQNAAGKFTDSQACDVATNGIGTFATAMSPWLYGSEPAAPTPDSGLSYDMYDTSSAAQMEAKKLAETLKSDAAAFTTAYSAKDNAKMRSLQADAQKNADALIAVCTKAGWPESSSIKTLRQTIDQTPESVKAGYTTPSAAATSTTPTKQATGTKLGSTVKVGQTVTVLADRNGYKTPIELTVTEVKKASEDDLKSIDEKSRKKVSQVYFVRAEATRKKDDNPDYYPLTDFHPEFQINVAGAGNGGRLTVTGDFDACVNDKAVPMQSLGPVKYCSIFGIEGDEALESVELTGINSMDEGSTPMYTWTTN